ncbi:MAG: hypothetical protein V8R91_06390 [Butyricimonas faecihominis]
MEQISFIVGSHYLITIQETDADYFKDVKKRLYDGKTRIRSFGTDYLCMPYWIPSLITISLT